MSVFKKTFSGLREELERTDLKPVKVEISDEMLIRLAITVILTVAFVFAMRFMFNSLQKG